jgi:type II secretory pathway pseudopilin PulG
MCPGFTIFEMLISMTLAIVLLLSLVMLYYGATKTAAREENISSASRDGRLLSRRLSQDLRLTGLIAPEDLGGDTSNDINRDVPGQAWSDTAFDAFEYASTYQLVFTGDVDDDNHTETTSLFLSGDSLIQMTWKWTLATRSWAGPVRRSLGTRVSRLIFDYYDRDMVRIPDTTGYRPGGFVLSAGQRRRATCVQIALVLRSENQENRIPETLVLPDGTTYNDRYRRVVIQFMVRGRNLSLGA